jgi:predicted GNAT family N-acyltransferase
MRIGHYTKISRPGPGDSLRERYHWRRDEPCSIEASVANEPPMKRDFCIKRVESPAELAAAMEIRQRVFVDEQEIPTALDDDGLDSRAIHVLVYRDRVAVATARLLVASEGEGIVARVAVLPDLRGQGLGKLLVRELEEVARELGLRRLVLHPHDHLESFYGDLGYEKIAGTSTVGRHALIAMAKRLG